MLTVPRVHHGGDTIICPDQAELYPPGELNSWFLASRAETSSSHYCLLPLPPSFVLAVSFLSPPSTFLFSFFFVRIITVISTHSIRSTHPHAEQAALNVSQQPLESHIALENMNSPSRATGPRSLSQLSKQHLKNICSPCSSMYPPCVNKNAILHRQRYLGSTIYSLARREYQKLLTYTYASFFSRQCRTITLLFQIITS